MSADNYYKIVRHPYGGYAAVMCFVSSPGYKALVTDQRFMSIGSAYDWAMQEYSEYGVTIDHDLEVEWMSEIKSPPLQYHDDKLRLRGTERLRKLLRR
jgi:hypothetical protein